MESRKLEHLVELASAGSFSRAADNLHLTQSALSKSIQALEDELGAALIDRQSKPIALTVKGELVVQRARRLLQEVDELQRVARDDAGPEGLLRIGFGAGPGAAVARPLVLHAVEHCPQVRVLVRHGSGEALINALHERQLDLIVVDARSFSSSPHLVVEPVGHLRGAVVCRKGHPLERLPSVTIHDLMAYPILNTSISDEAVRWVQEHYNTCVDIRTHTTVESEQLDLLVDICAHSDAIFLGVLEAARQRILQGELTELTVTPKAVFEVPIGVVRMAGRSHTPLTQWVRDFVLRTLSDKTVMNERG